MARISKGAWDDQLVDPQVHIDGPIAVVWSHYKFTVRYMENGVAHAPMHCGVETFQLYRTESGWKIVNFADTQINTLSGIGHSWSLVGAAKRIDKRKQPDSGKEAGAHESPS